VPNERLYGRACTARCAMRKCAWRMAPWCHSWEPGERGLKLLKFCAWRLQRLGFLLSTTDRLIRIERPEGLARGGSKGGEDS
jgi:hypothetical protein